VGVDGVAHELPLAVQKVDGPQDVVVDVLEQGGGVLVDPSHLPPHERAHDLP
jgi:hypothetical protein